MTNRERNMKRFVRYMRRTLRNKIAALGLIGLGAVTLPICDGDGTFFVVTLIMGACLFFANEDCFY